MNYRSIANLTLCMLVAASVPAFAQWGPQATLATNALNGTVTRRLCPQFGQRLVPERAAQGHSRQRDLGEHRGVWPSLVHAHKCLRTDRRGIGHAVRAWQRIGERNRGLHLPALGGTLADHPSGGSWTAPANTNGVNQLYVSSDNGDEGLAWGTDQTRVAAGYASIAVVQRPAGGVWKFRDDDRHRRSSESRQQPGGAGRIDGSRVGEL